MSVGCLLASPHANTLFQRAILMSGGASNAVSAADNARTSQAFAAELGGGSLAREEVMKHDSAVLRAAQAKLSADVNTFGNK